MSGVFAFIWLQQFEIDILHSAPSAPSLCSMITPCPRDQRPWFGGHNFFPFWKTGFQRSLPWFHNQREQFGHNYIPPIRGHDIGVDFRPPKSPENKCPKNGHFWPQKTKLSKKNRRYCRQGRPFNGGPCFDIFAGSPQVIVGRWVGGGS